MVKLPVVHSLNAKLVQTQPIVAVFFSTGGIAHQTLLALATAEANNKESKGLRAYIIGRNATTGEGIISECQKVCPKGTFRFVKADDLSLLKEIDKVCAEIVQIEEKLDQNPRIDYLMMGQGSVPYRPRKDTIEGLDFTMSLMYYSRMKIILNLLPLLLNSTLPSTIVSVYAAGIEDKLNPDDLSLRNNFTYSQARSHMVYMHTLFMETLSSQNPSKLRLIHIFPGLVVGPGFQSPELPRWFRIFVRWIFVPFFERFIAVDPKESGERMLSLASPMYPPKSGGMGEKEGEAIIGTDRKIGSGAYALNWNGEDKLNAQAYGKFDKEEMRGKVWEHTMKAFDVIESGRVFTD